MAHSAWPGLPQAEILRDGGSNQYLVSSDGGATSESLGEGDILCLIPTGDGNQDPKDYVLLYVSAKDCDTKGVSKTADLSLRKFKIKQPPKELSRYMLNANPDSFFGDIRNPSNRVELSVIVSVKSGTCEAEEFYDRILKDLLSSLGISPDQHRVYFTESERWIAEFASQVLCKKANEGLAQSVLLLSGDGGVVDIINGIFALPQTSYYVKPKIGLLVFGTGNALANSSKLNISNSRGLQAVFHGLARNIPTFVCKCSTGSVLLIDEGRSTEEMDTDEQGDCVVHGAVVASWCLHATLVADSDTTEYRKFGSERFSMAANELLVPSNGSPPHQWQGKITIYRRSPSGEVQSETLGRQTHMYILATLVSHLEATLNISPKSDPLDGQFRLVEFPPLPPAEVKKIFGMAFDSGRHIEHESVGYTEIEGLRIDFEESDPRWRRICIDGKIIRIPEGGWMEVRRETREVVDLMIRL